MPEHPDISELTSLDDWHAYAQKIDKPVLLCFYNDSDLDLTRKAERYTIENQGLFKIVKVNAGKYPNIALEFKVQ